MSIKKKEERGAEKEQEVYIGDRYARCASATIICDFHRIPTRCILLAYLHRRGMQLAYLVGYDGSKKTPLGIFF